jgi:hypothetical protein
MVFLLTISSMPERIYYSMNILHFDHHIMATHRSVPSEFEIKTILPISKSHNVTLLIVHIFMTLLLALVFCELLDNIIVGKFHDKLNTYDNQLMSILKAIMCTLVLKETLAFTG